MLGVPPQTDGSYYVGFEAEGQHVGLVPGGGPQRRGEASVTEVCFAVGCSSLGTFSSRFTELVGMPPSTYRRHAARATAGMPPCVAKQVTRPIKNRAAPVAEPRLG